jgi:O-antigen biosynthesis protein
MEPERTHGQRHATSVLARPAARGKFLYANDEKLLVRGATYGAFRPDDQKREYRDFDQIDRDFFQMAAAGFNAVRIPHTMPPREVLDIAERHGLRVMVGLSAEQYVGYLADPQKAPDIDAVMRKAVQTCKRHPALLAYALGNEIPASMARWLGRRKVERYLEHLYRVVKAEDPGGLVTYVNYPSTEYLQLPFLDFLSFNVYLESDDRLRAYLARLQNIAGDRPLLMSEMGLDSMRNGVDGQARSLERQVRTTFSSGCCGAFVFAWTDEWYRGGADVDDWAFGLTDHLRQPKPAFHAVQRAFSDVPFPAERPWPRVSVVVCVYNGVETIKDCCEGLAELDYPNYEVIVVDDGSIDGTADIVARYGFQLIRTPNRGLSQARNTGMEAATGEIVAYTDGDACPDRHWLMHLAAAFMNSSHVGIGGWNLAHADDGWIADCVANAPGGPVHVLLSDTEAEHIPGCSMAFRKDALQAIDGFDPQFRAAGDDVDVCWRLQEQGGTLGFDAGAMVWHHHRNSVRAYWKQQGGYGRAEAMLERKWPEKYNVAGHLTWRGRLYGSGLALPIGRVSRIYHGIWGLAPFQHLSDQEPGLISMLLLMPEWYLVVLALGILTALGLSWSPLMVATPFFVWSIVAPIAQAIASANRARFANPPVTRLGRWRRFAMVALLHLVQPLARLQGRIRHGLTLWRKRGNVTVGRPWPRRFPLWVGRWQAPEERLRHLTTEMEAMGAVVLHCGDFDAWDLEVRGGMFGASRLLMAVEDSGSGTQVVRVRSWPRFSWVVCLAFTVCVFLSIAAARDGAYVAVGALAFIAALIGGLVLHDCGIATQTIQRGLERCDLCQGDAKAQALEPKHGRP